MPACTIVASSFFRYQGKMRAVSFPAYAVSFNHPSMLMRRLVLCFTQFTASFPGSYLSPLSRQGTSRREPWERGSPVSHFRVAWSLCFKARLSAKLLFSQKRLSTKHRFETESFWQSKITYLVARAGLLEAGLR